MLRGGVIILAPWGYFLVFTLSSLQNSQLLGTQTLPPCNSSWLPAYADLPVTHTPLGMTSASGPLPSSPCYFCRFQWPHHPMQYSTSRTPLLQWSSPIFYGHILDLIVSNNVIICRTSAMSISHCLRPPHSVSLSLRSYSSTALSSLRLSLLLDTFSFLFTPISCIAHSYRYYCNSPALLCLPSLCRPNSG